MLFLLKLHIFSTLEKHKNITKHRRGNQISLIIKPSEPLKTSQVLNQAAEISGRQNQMSK